MYILLFLICFLVLIFLFYEVNIFYHFDVRTDIPSYKELNSEEEKILIRLEELYKMKMQYMSIPEEKEKFKRKIYEDIISGKVECPKGYSKEQYFNALIQSFEIQSNINVEESKPMKR